MAIEYLVHALVLLVAVALVARVSAPYLHLPHASLLVILGYLASELVILFGMDTGLRAGNFQQYIHYLFIPILVFVSACSINRKLLRQNLLPVFLLSTLVLLSTVLITAVLLYLGIDHNSGFPMVAALLCAVILATTDPTAMVEIMKRLHVPDKLVVMAEGESLFSDAVAISLYAVCLSAALAMSGSASVLVGSHTDMALYIAGTFLYSLTGGLVTGLVIALPLAYLVKWLRQASDRFATGLLIVYLVYLTADFLEVSGVMAVLVAGLIYARLQDNYPAMQTQSGQASAWQQARTSWQMLSHFISVSVFIIVGAIMSIDMFEQRWLAIVLAILALLVARALSVHAILGLVSHGAHVHMPMHDRHTLVNAGQRGAVTLALALSLPVELEYWWTIQSIAFGVVAFSLFIHLPLSTFLLRRACRENR